MDLSKKYNPKAVEEKWQEKWKKMKIYRFDKNNTKKKIYSIDTPPPTVSGNIHMGHAFSYSHTDFIARYQRMRGKNVFYPFGFDDNGLPTEKYVEKKRKIKGHNMDRQAFIKICLEECEDAEKLFTGLWTRIGLSVDWNLKYSSIDQRAQKTCQKAFVDLYDMGKSYIKEAPSIWCPGCRTTLAQVELEDKEFDSYFNDIIFELENGEKIVIATTRPELLPACVAVIVHPDNEKTKYLINKKVKVPLFNNTVKVIADKRVDPDKGSGIVMCCTFGDQTDMEWWKAYNLELKTAITPAGKMTELAGKYKDMKIEEARKAIINDLKKEGLLIKQKPIKHTVNVHDRCGKPIEFLVKKQWFYKLLDRKKEFLEQGNKINWYPKFMKVRFDNWIKGLQWDWSVSRQRFYGIPIPVWYCKECGKEFLPKTDELPVDPTKDKAPVKKCTNCGCNEFIGDKDVFDTWSCSSLTPQINAWWIDETGNKNICKKIYPFSLRPQAHDIITFWAFNTVVQSLYHNKSIPWENIMISGHALDQNSQKMSKSKGNVVEPQEVLDKFSADALRFWAAGTKLGDDLPYLEKDLKTGLKFANKIWNASKFSIMHLEDYNLKAKDIKLFPADHWILNKMNETIKNTTDSFEKYAYSKAKKLTEYFFLVDVCDNYLEIVKDRLYNPQNYDKQSRLAAQYTLYQIILNSLKMSAPITPYVTEETYQLYFAKAEKIESIHISPWPEELKKVDKKQADIGELAIKIVAAIRKFKSDNRMALNEKLSEIIIQAPKELHNELKTIEPDIKGAVKSEKLILGKAEHKIEGTDILFSIKT